MKTSSITRAFKTIFIAFILLTVQNALAQLVVEGRVTDGNGLPLPGVNVFVPQTNLGTTTDKDGSYSLAVPANLRSPMLEFSMIGYRSRLGSVQFEPSKKSQKVRLDMVLAESPLELEEVTVSAGFLKEKELLPYPVSTIMKNELSSLGSLNLAEALSRGTGVYFSRLGMGIGKPVIRGLTNANIIMVNNGAKLENFNFSSNHPFLVDEFSSDRIEVIKGPASLQYGSDAVGGVVNLVPEQPAEPNSLQGDLLSHYNTNTQGFLNSIAIKSGGKKWFAGLRASVKSHGDYTAGNDTVVKNTRFNEQNITANLGLRTGIGVFRLTFADTKADYGLQNQNQINLFNNNAAKPYLLEGRKNQVWYQNLDNQLISFDNTLFLGRNTLDILLAYQMNKRQGVGGAWNAQTKELVIPVFSSMQLNTLTYHLKFNIPSENNKLIIGLNGANIENQADETKPSNPLLDSKVSDVGLYAISDMALSQKINFTGGLRFDIRSMESFPQATQTTNQYKIDNTYRSLSGSAGISYNPSPWQFIKLNLARGYRSPSMPELTQNGIHSARYERGDPNLKSQVNYQIDLNYHYHNPWLVFEISPYINLINNYIYLVMTNEPAPIGQGKIFQHVQNDARFVGSEFMLDIHPLRWLGLHANYSMVRAEIANNSEGIKHPTFIPQDRFVSEIKFETKSLAGWLEQPYLSIEAMHFIKQTQTGQNEAPSPAYTLFNLRAGAAFRAGKQSIQLFVNGNNLTNVSYIDHLSVTRQLGQKMIGRNFVLGLRLPLVYHFKN